MKRFVTALLGLGCILCLSLGAEAEGGRVDAGASPGERRDPSAPSARTDAGAPSARVDAGTASPPPLTSSEGGLASISPSGSLPDPAPLSTRHQWVVDLTYREGAISFGGARRVEFEKALATPRHMGRFALELYIGKELIDRVRFDFPLLGAEDLAQVGSQKPLSFETRLVTSAAVMVPHSERATRAVLVDRATQKVWPLPYPFAARTEGRDGGK